MLTEIDRIKMLGPMETYQYLLAEPEAPEALRKKMRWGFLNPPIDIYEVESLRLKGKKGMIIHRNKAFKLADLFTDLERRMIPVKQWLIEQQELTPAASAR